MTEDIYENNNWQFSQTTYNTSPLQTGLKMQNDVEFPAQPL